MSKNSFKQKINNNKKIIIVLGSLLVILGCSWGIYLKNKNSGYQGPVEKIRLTTSAAAPDFSGLIWIAENQGYFKQQKVDVVINQKANGIIAQEDAAVGLTDIATTSDYGFVKDSSNLPNLRILSSIDQSNVLEMIGRRDRGINSQLDLKGKKIGTGLNTSTEYFLDNFLALNHIGLNEVTIVNVPLTDSQAAITSGKVDAILTNQPFVYNIKKALGKNAVDWTAQGYQDIYWLLVANQKYTEAHPGTISRFLTAIVQADQFEKVNPEKSKEIVVNKLALTKDYIEQNWPQHNYTVSLSQSLIDTMEAEGQWQITNKLNSQIPDPDYRNFIYFNALQSVRPGSITIIH